ncbi:MAG TPA: hypothetical protein VJ885_04320 [Thermoanaerobaculia bacterium]|nr:hypothetical protein [Thermoanaerobaculia bacterium]
MKARLSLALMVIALAFTLVPSQAATTCSSYCSRVRCAGDQICGQYVNSSGQTVCGCHPR